ncbi:hypothetical protein BDP27DRAFT_1420058 [Rhodocollybia butyracea]|uniref:Uncharacterized protein n=1 Tax=Rhodocollybia butyracea TaxID=206335 RepID=A0A9P5PY95_9AGAR|nr:hypothetical protein BDP27DRAFT_1420058 [Rhodocollybia butyracea]
MNLLWRIGMIVATPKDEKVSFSLPVPRRRNGEEGGPRRTASSVDLHPPSPTIPMFSNEAVINSWSSGALRKPEQAVSPVSPFSASKGTHSPSPSLPVIPSRSPKRSTSASSPSNEKLSIPTLPPLPPTTSATLLNVERHRSPVEHSKSDLESESSSKRAIRKSLGSEVSNTNANASSYIRKRATSGSGRPKTSPDPSSISARVSLSRSEPQHFRTHGALSDKEKADKWNDLLERSRRAGGTLHLNGMNKLASDGLGFSGNDSEDELQNDL